MDRVRQRRGAPLSALPFSCILQAPFGALGICTLPGQDGDEELREIRFLPLGTTYLAPQTPFAARVAAELGAYLEDPRHTFGLPLPVQGTPFQRRVWATIAAIPCGHTRRYGELADELGSAARAVGQACGANPYPLIIPCHRVVASHGGGGFAHASTGYTLDAKRWLLGHEMFR